MTPYPWMTPQERKEAMAYEDGFLGWVKRLGEKLGFRRREYADRHSMAGLMAEKERREKIVAQVRRSMRSEYKAFRLAQIARERTSLKEALEKAKRQKAKRTHIYAALDKLRREELELEMGR